MSEPRRPILIISPNCAGLVGSPTMQASMRSPRAASRSSIGLVPLTAGPSSSPVMSSAMEPGTGPMRETASTKAAIAPFMSAAPRPVSRPPATVAEKGGTLQSAGSPTGTTSVCPAKQNSGPSLPRRA